MGDSGVLLVEVQGDTFDHPAVSCLQAGPVDPADVGRQVTR